MANSSWVRAAWGAATLALLISRPVSAQYNDDNAGYDDNTAAGQLDYSDQEAAGTLNYSDQEAAGAVSDFN